MLGWIQAAMQQNTIFPISKSDNKIGKFWNRKKSEYTQTRPVWCYWSILLSTCRKVSVVMLMSDTLTKERQQRLLSCIFAPFLYQIIFGTGVSWKRPGVWKLPYQFLPICIQLYLSSFIKAFFTVKLDVLTAVQEQLLNGK